MRFQSRRLTTWLLGGGYLLVVLGAIAMSPKRLPPGVGAGVVSFKILTTIHTLATILLAVRFAAQSIDDKPSGTLGFLKIANLSPRSWIAFRAIAMVLDYLPVWVLRLPVYALVLSLGGVFLEDVLWLEAVLTVGFVSLSCVGLLISRYSTTGTAVAIGTFLSIALWHLFLVLPMAVLGIISLVENKPLAVADHPWAQAFSQLALPRLIWSIPTGTEQWTLAGISITMHLAIGAFLLRLLARTVYVGAGTEMSDEAPTLTRADQKVNSRPSRRVSDDALAWQALHVHCSHSRRARIGSAVFAAACVLVLAFVVAKEDVPRTILIGVSSGITLLVLAFKPSDCLSRELRGKTLSTLALLPLDGKEIYEGWARGSRQMALPAYVATGLGAVLMLLIAPDRAPYWGLVMAGAVLLLPEAAFVSNVLARKVPFLHIDWLQVAVNLWSVFVLGVLLAISLPIAVAVNAWAGLAVFIGCSFVARWLLVDNLARYMELRVEREQ